MAYAIMSSALNALMQKMEMQKQSRAKTMEMLVSDAKRRRIKRVDADLMQKWDGTGQGLMDYARNNNTSIEDLDVLAPMINEFAKMHNLDLRRKQTQLQMGIQNDNKTKNSPL